MKQNDSISVNGYLPKENPPFWKILFFALQHLFVMFPATVAVALISGIPVSTTLFTSGLSTIVFIIFTQRKMPLYYGSSFAYLSAITVLISTLGFEKQNGILPVEAIRTIQFGIICSGLLTIFFGFIACLFGKNIIKKIFPPSVTGSIAIVIGLTLAGTAITDSSPAVNQSQIVWLVSLVTLFTAILVNHYGKGFLKQLSLLIAIAVGCILSAAIYLFSGGDISLFRSVPNQILAENSLLNIGNVFSLPPFSLPKPSLKALLTIAPIALATIPETIAHVFQLDIYVTKLSKEKGATEKNTIVTNNVGIGLIGDGLCDVVAGLLGGPANTSYGENMSVMALTKVYSSIILIVTALIAILISCFTFFIGGIYAIPLSVIGGLELYLFGSIAVQGFAIIKNGDCDIFSSKNIAIISIILMIGIGGNYAFNGIISVANFEIPTTTLAAIIGIIINLVLSDNKPSLKQ